MQYTLDLCQPRLSTADHFHYNSSTSKVVRLTAAKFKPRMFSESHCFLRKEVIRTMTQYYCYQDTEIASQPSSAVATLL
jgi:hypothetical protein